MVLNRWLASFSCSRPIPEIRLFHTMTFKFQGQGHVCGQIQIFNKTLKLVSCTFTELCIHYLISSMVTYADRGQDLLENIEPLAATPHQHCIYCKNLPVRASSCCGGCQYDHFVQEWNTFTALVNCKFCYNLDFIIICVYGQYTAVFPHLT